MGVVSRAELRDERWGEHGVFCFEGVMIPHSYGLGLFSSKLHHIYIIESEPTQSSYLKKAIWKALKKAVKKKGGDKKP